MSSAIKIKSPRSSDQKSHTHRKKDDKSQQHLWGSTYDREMNQNWNVFQREIAKSSENSNITEYVPEDEIIQINDSTINPFATNVVYDSPDCQNR